MANTPEPTEANSNISLYNKPLINSLSLVSHIYIITTIYLCCHTHFLANFRHTEREIEGGGGGDSGHKPHCTKNRSGQQVNLKKYIIVASYNQIDQDRLLEQ